MNSGRSSSQSSKLVNSPFKVLDERIKQPGVHTPEEETGAPLHRVQDPAHPPQREEGYVACYPPPVGLGLTQGLGPAD